ncbi:MAG: hypothetical protein H6674_11170 [Dehalococcoidia bacterium]|nr:hypothetical protein [Dehalococcoidia bacterium]
MRRPNRLLLPALAALSLASGGCDGCGSSSSGERDASGDAIDDVDADTDGGGSDADADTDADTGGPDTDADAGDVDTDGGDDTDADTDGGGTDADADADVTDDCLPAPTCTTSDDCAEGETCSEGWCQVWIDPQSYPTPPDLRWVNAIALGPPGEVTTFDVDGDGVPENLVGTLLGSVPDAREYVEQQLSQFVESGAFTVAVEVERDADVCGATPGSRLTRAVLHPATRDLDYDGIAETTSPPTLQILPRSFGDTGPTCQLNEGSWNPETGETTLAGGSACELIVPLFDGTTVRVPVRGVQARLSDDIAKDGTGSFEIGGYIKVEDIVDEANRLGSVCACAGIDTSSPVAVMEQRGATVEGMCIQDVSGAEACSEVADGPACANLIQFCSALTILGSAADVESGDIPGVDDALSFGLFGTMETGTAATPAVGPELQAVGDHYSANDTLNWPYDIRESHVDVLANDSYVPATDSLQSATVLSPEGGQVTATIDAGRIHVVIEPTWPGVGTAEVRIDYTVGDGASRSSGASLTLSVTGQTPAPVANDDDFTFEWGATDYTLTVLANDTVEAEAFPLLVAADGGDGGTATVEHPVVHFAPTRAGVHTVGYSVQALSGRGSPSELAEATATVTLTCPDGAFGATCTACPDCGTGSCNDGADGDGTCSCPDGTFGAACTACPDCGAGSCNDGVDGDGTCACPDGTFGAACTACPDCGAGTCNDGVDGDGTCSCPDGTFGATCTACPDCGSGSCNDGVDGDGTCSCPDGTFGATCAACPDCGSGSCNDGVDGDGTCSCPDGTFGATCTACPDCGSGSCNDGVDGDGTCSCPDGTFGATCTACPDCGAGTCNDGVDGDGTCSCPADTYGAFCAACPDCGLGSCNDGLEGDGLCTCPDGAYGPACDACPDCGLGSCNDGADGDGLCSCPVDAYGPACDACPDCGVGTCFDGASGDGTCRCPTGYEGESSCEDINECSTFALCPETSVCDNFDGGYTCECPAGELGDGLVCTTPVSCEDGGELLCLIDDVCVDLAVVEGFDCVPVGGLVEVARFAEISAGFQMGLTDDCVLAPFVDPQFPTLLTACASSSWDPGFLVYPTAGAASADPVTGRAIIGGGYIEDGQAFLLTPGVEGLETTAALVPDSEPPSGATYGYSVAVSDDLAVVGDAGFSGSGAAFAFDISTPDSPVSLTRFGFTREEDGDNFGYSVAAGGGVFAVGAPSGGGAPEGAGVVEVYTPGDGGIAQQTLSDDRLGAGSAFGTSVAISSDGQYLVVGAPWTFFDGGSGSGAVFVYERQSDGSYAQIDELLSTSIESGFGSAVAVDNGGRVVVGAPYEGGSGTAYVYEPGRFAGTWVMTYREVATFGSGFGNVVAAGAGRVAIGSLFGDVVVLETAP